jgi:hypothetical protein
MKQVLNQKFHLTRSFVINIPSAVEILIQVHCADLITWGYVKG